MRENTTKYNKNKPIWEIRKKKQISEDDPATLNINDIKKQDIFVGKLFSTHATVCTI